MVTLPPVPTDSKGSTTMKCLLALIVLGALDGSSTFATAGQTTTIESQAREARRIVIAKVTHVQARFDTNQFGDRLIVSDLLVEVEETLKGAPSNVIQITIEGGTIGELTLNVSDLPAMKSGDRALFFLDEQAPGRHVPHNRGLGILRVDRAGRVDAGTTLDEARRAVRAALPSGR
jgi:hypothetical protein